jgi:bifunctional aspartokinase / homoserine dehydrogenase 1
MTPLQKIAHSTRINPSTKPVKKIFLAGVGAVGSTFLNQAAARPSLRVLGVCNSTRALWFDKSAKEYSLNALRRSPEKEWDQIVRKLTAYERGSVVFVDSTGDPEVADLYPELLGNGIHVVTPSKLANTGTQQVFDELHQTAAANEVEFRYETNVGAGLPVIGTLRSLIESGDEILQISGVVSGTMTYLFSQLDQGESFSDTVIRARTLGYAEPDPRDDLSGEDVARKFLILARVCGKELERDDVEVESLIPEPLRDVDATTFLERLHEADEEWSNRLGAEHKQNRTLRYTGSFQNGTIEVGVESVPQNSPTGGLKGTTNLIEIRSRRYNDQPLIIQGPGAGKEVTAAGVLADVLKIR